MDRILWTLRALAGHWRRRPAQLAALMAGIALATALWSGVQALNLAARDGYDRAAALLGGAATVTVARPEGGRFDEALWARLRRSGWPVSPVLEGRVLIDGVGVRLVGVEPLTLPPGAALTELGAAADVDAALRLLAPPGAALAAPETLRLLGRAAGDAPVTDDGARLLALVERPGVAPATLVLDIGAAQQALRAEGLLSRLVAPAGHGRDPAALADLTGGALAQLGRGPDDDVARLTESFHLNLTAFGLLSFVVGLFVAHAAVGLAFEQRLPVVRTLRACGASARDVGAALAIELVALALVAGAAGLIGGRAIASALASDVATTLRALYAAPATGELALSARWWLSGLGMALAGAAAAAAGGLRRAVTLPVLAPAQPAQWLAAHRRRIATQGWAALALLAAAALVAALGDGLAAGFALLATLLLGAALGAPVLLDAALALAARQARAPLAQWVVADARAGLGGLSLALMALLLALAANIGVGTMVGGFRQGFEGWLDNRLAAEIYARAPDEATAAALKRYAEADPRVAALLPSLTADQRVGGWPTELLGVANHATYRERWPTLAAEAGAWDAVAAGTGALVSEQLARRLDLDLGDTVTAAGASGPWPLRVVGVHPDYGNPRGQLVVGLEALTARVPDATRGGYGLRTPAEDVPAVLRGLASAPGLEALEAVDQAAVRRLSLGLFDRTFAVTSALNALTLAVAGAALFASLATLADARLTQAAPLWAMGVTRARIAALEVARLAALAALIAVLAVPVGLALAWALIAVVNVQAFGWRLPMVVFPTEWLRLGGLAVAVAALAAVPTARRLARAAPARLLAAFTQDR